MLESRRPAGVFVTILVESKSYKNLIFDSKDLDKKKLLYI